MSQVFSGPRAILKVGGKRVGYCTEVSGSTQIEQAPIEEIGEIDVTEHVAVARRVSGLNAAFVRIIDKDLVSQGIMAAGGADVAEVVNFPEMTMQIYDRVADKIAYQIEGVKVSSTSWQIGARSICSTNVQFVARKQKESSELA